MKRIKDINSLKNSCIIHLIYKTRGISDYIFLCQNFDLLANIVMVNWSRSMKEWKLQQHNHQAKAVCSENEEIANPCNGPALLKYEHLTAKGANPSIECPTGYEAVICNAHSYWTEL